MSAAVRRVLARSRLFSYTSWGSSRPDEALQSASFSTLATALRRKESREAECSSPWQKESCRKRELSEPDHTHFQEKATSHLLNLSKPAEFYPAARCESARAHSSLRGFELLQRDCDARFLPTDCVHPRSSFRRRIILHVGPTNSGKTHSALKARRRAAITPPSLCHPPEGLPPLPSVAHRHFWPLPAGSTALRFASWRGRLQSASTAKASPAISSQVRRAPWELKPPHFIADARSRHHCRRAGAHRGPWRHPSRVHRRDGRSDPPCRNRNHRRDPPARRAALHSISHPATHISPPSRAPDRHRPSSLPLSRGRPSLTPASTPQATPAAAGPSREPSWAFLRASSTCAATPRRWNSWPSSPQRRTTRSRRAGPPPFCSVHGLSPPASLHTLCAPGVGDRRAPIEVAGWNDLELIVVAQVHHYNRLSPLIVERKPLLDFEQGMKARTRWAPSSMRSPAPLSPKKSLWLLG